MNTDAEPVKSGGRLFHSKLREGLTRTYGAGNDSFRTLAHCFTEAKFYLLAGMISLAGCFGAKVW